MFFSNNINGSLFKKIFSRPYILGSSFEEPIMKHQPYGQLKNSAAKIWFLTRIGLQLNLKCCKKNTQAHLTLHLSVWGKSLWKKWYGNTAQYIKLKDIKPYIDWNRRIVWTRALWNQIKLWLLKPSSGVRWKWRSTLVLWLSYKWREREKAMRSEFITV